MSIIFRVKRKIQKLCCNFIYYSQKRKHRYTDKGVVTIFHDYERNYHDPRVNEYSDLGVRRIIETEKKYDIKATYNIVARLFDEVAVQPIIDKIRKNGHEFASHSYSHSILNTLSKKQIEQDIKSTKLIFFNNNLKLQGLRSPQSRWKFEHLPIMMKYGLMWTAENDTAEYPYTILQRNHRKLVRMPIMMDDWDYEQINMPANEMYQKLLACIKKISQKKIYGAVGFHPWVQGKETDRLKVFEELLEFVSKQNDIEILTFTQSYKRYTS